MPRKLGEKDRRIGKKMCERRFDPNELYNPFIIYFLLIYECMQVKSGDRHVTKCSN